MFTDVVHGASSIHAAVSSYTGTAESASDLGLLRSIETTVDVVCAEARFYRANAGTGRFLVSSIRALPVERQRYLDVDGTLDLLLDRFVSAHEGMLANTTARKGAIDNDHRLRSHHSDQLHTAYDDLLQSLAAAIDTAREVAAALIAHDLAAEPRDGETFATVGQLHDAMTGR